MYTSLTMFFEANGVSLKSVWNTVGVELVIFAVTVAFAAVIRLIQSQQVPKAKKHKLADQVYVPDRPVCPQPKPRAAAETSAARAPLQRAPRSQGAVAKNKQPSELVNNIMALMRENPGQKSAGQALHLYSELRASLGLLSDSNADGANTSICDAMRRSKYSPIDLYTTLVQCAVRSSQSYLVESLLADMVQIGVTRSVVFYESTMKQLAGKKEYRLALKVFDRFSADGLEPSAVTCSCLINFATELGEIDRAVSFFEKLSTLTTPSIRAYMTVLRALSKQHDWTKSLAIFRKMLESDVAVDSLVLNIVLATGVAADKLTDVKELLVEAGSMSTPISDIVSYNTLIKGYAQRGEATQALQAVTLIQSRGLQPNAITFNTVMDAVVRAGDCDKVWEVLDRMRDCGLKPDKFTCSIFIKSITKHPTPAKIQTALDLLDESVDNTDSALLASQYNSIVAAAAGISDDVLMMQTVSKMRQRQIALTENSSKKLRERS